MKKESIEICEVKIQARMNRLGLTSHQELQYYEVPSPVVFAGTTTCQGEGTMLVIGVGSYTVLG